MRTAADKRAFAVYGIEALGEKAEPAIPKLESLLTNVETSFGTRVDAATCLITIGKAAVPALTAAATNASPRVRAQALTSLGLLGTNSLSSAQVIIERLEDESPAVRENAARSLGQIGASPDFVLPKLVPLLSDSNSMVRYGAVAAIGQIGQKAPEARDALMPLLNDPDEMVRIRTKMALKRISQTIADSGPQ